MSLRYGLHAFDGEPVTITTPLTFASTDLVDFARGLLAASGLPADKADAVAAILVEGDLMGHDTHGLALLAGYLEAIETGTMRREGEPLVIADSPAAVTWDGQRLPGPWLVLKAMEEAAQRAARLGTGTVVIRRSHHIASLESFLRRATDRGLLMILTCSDPNTASVAPFGGLDPVFTPNPMAFGIPAPGTPVLVDISTSATTNGMTNRMHKEGRQFDAHWLLDGLGAPSTDPGVLFREPKGTILPLGGMDSGHKGYGLALMVEALTGGLAGHGRADPPEGWGATVFLQIIDPRAFAGIDAFHKQIGTVVDQCRASRPGKPGRPVRTPGERGSALAAKQRQSGVALHPSIMPALEPWAAKLGVPAPLARSA
ncbi:Ldh family oxidoreductase [Caenimonas koreensis DSM 17982]|uniref:Ldh family oxidoreductase n=1 Tax=Caenimonas koreensis DSM 17982 TaxID=1121255 RepID=A0A844B2B3_9BURK|nr:Ldh family oxidoreductase [Caenimonas koreensis DSM 17982]